MRAFDRPVNRLWLLVNEFDIKEEQVVRRRTSSSWSSSLARKSDCRVESVRPRPSAATYKPCWQRLLARKGHPTPDSS
jgi:hypothetical protein